MSTQARVVVIGGGAVGASCLYHLAEMGCADAILVERDELTSGSTWHAAGHIPTYAGSWGLMRAGNYAWRLYKDLGERVGYPINYHVTGCFWPAHSQERMELFHNLAGISKGLGTELRMLSPAEMEAMNPHYRAGDVIGGIHDPYEGDIDPSQLTQALAKGARDKGAKIERFNRVTAISGTASGEWKVTTKKGDILCEAVVNAAGFYGGEVAAMVGQALPIATLEHQYLVTDGLPGLADRSEKIVMVRDPDLCFYLRQERDGLLFGSYGHAGRPVWLDGPPADFASQLFPDRVDDILEVMARAMDHLPFLENARPMRYVNGPIPYAPDGQALCGPAFGLPNFYHACAIQVGITHSAAAGKAIAEWITEGETEWDMWMWDPRRFGDWADADYAVTRSCELYEHQYAIPYPHRIWTSARPVQTTLLYETLKAKGAVFGQIGGWERAFWFERDGARDGGRLSFHHESWHGAVRAECEAVRDGVGVMDHGGFTRYEVEGPGAAAFLDRVFCGSLPTVGRVKLSYMLTPKGRIYSEATIARLSDDRFLLCGPTLAERRDFDWLVRWLPDDGAVDLRAGSARDAALMIMGPKSRTLLSRLTEADLSKDAAPWMSVREIEIAGMAVTALRVSYVGELGWELHLASDELPRLYAAVEEAGADLGLVDFGSYSLNAMRLEKGYHGWQADFGVEYTVFDAGLERFVSFDKADFVGRAAVLAQRGRQPDWAFAGFLVDSEDIEPMASDPILQDGNVVGFVTSGGTGFRIGRHLALGFLRPGSTSVGQSFTIETIDQELPAIRAATPFYDPENARLKS